MRRLGAHHVIEVEGDCVLVVGRAGPSPEVVAQVEQAVRAARASRTQLGYLQIILPERGDGAIGPETRRAFAEMIARSGHLVSAAGVVILRRGFAGAAVRSVTSGLLLARRLPFASRVFSTAPDGARWISAKLGADAGALVQAIARLELLLAHAA